jgi:hypothetical protein
MTKYKIPAYTYGFGGQASRAALPRFGMTISTRHVIPSESEARPTAWQRQAGGDLCSFNTRTSG